MLPWLMAGQQSSNLVGTCISEGPCCTRHPFVRQHEQRRRMCWHLPDISNGGRAWHPGDDRCHRFLLLATRSSQACACVCRLRRRRNEVEGTWRLGLDASRLDTYYTNTSISFCKKTPNPDEVGGSTENRPSEPLHVGIDLRFPCSFVGSSLPHRINEMRTDLPLYDH
ncbi:hypothetical protein BD309DRAFT_217558 [Dichomitus squalens]|uniref:Uncharacterized protein n=1 Tax=Dichomitus squalens TaxID=114155 RepID=A0A4Q9NN21_9APHY|nr:hypothetical protein BD309DRAFT_217558 [Dichomitus squalens]TBU60365.1 hypothetical protein BD310DRAFT_329182 [Dichomitus squalens]